MKVVFLDVDGVLNSERDLMIYRKRNNISGCILYDEVEERALKLLEELINKTGAVIVLSSTWRLGFLRDKGQSSSGVLMGGLQEKIETALKRHGMSIYDVTPYLYSAEKHYQRGDEIRKWLSEHEEVESFVILDDDSDMCEFTETNLVKTTYKDGLRRKHITKAIQMLNKGDRREKTNGKT